MKIGFIQPDEDDSSEAVLGYAETAANEGNGDGGWLEWWWRVLLDFSLVYGILAIVEDFINYIRGWWNGLAVLVEFPNQT